MQNKKIKLGSNKFFGILFGIIFLVIALWPIKNSDETLLWALILSLCFFILGYLNSQILTPFHYLWIRLGLLLSKIVSPLIMFIIFFGIVSPIGIFMRLIGKDLLRLKKYPVKSYWISRGNFKQDMKDQF